VKTKGANRSFGLLIAAFCALLALFAARAGRPSAIGWIVATAIFLSSALLMPRILAPLRRGWLRLGHALSRVVNPIVLGAIYAAVFVPAAAIMRLVQRDAMAQRHDPARASYWIERAADRPAAERLKEQF
jgi:hypothetical protein